MTLVWQTYIRHQSHRTDIAGRMLGLTVLWAQMVRPWRDNRYEPRVLSNQGLEAKPTNGSGSGGEGRDAPWTNIPLSMYLRLETPSKTQLFIGHHPNF